MDVQESVRRFHEATLIPVGVTPSPLTLDRLKLRLSLFDEFIELLQASGVPDEECGWLKDTLNSFISRLDGRTQDVTEMADALGDIVVVAFGMAIEMGIDLNRVLAEIMRANMSKLDENGNPMLNQCVLGGCVQPCMERSHWKRPDEPHGKVLKASGYTPPDVASVLGTQPPL